MSTEFGAVAAARDDEGEEKISTMDITDTAIIVAATIRFNLLDHIQICLYKKIMLIYIHNLRIDWQIVVAISAHNIII